MMVDARQLPDFNERQLAMVIEALPSETVDELPYGAIRIGDDGKAEYHSAAERRLSAPAITTASASTSSAGSRPVWTIPTFAAASSVPGFGNARFEVQTRRRLRGPRPGTGSDR